MPGHLSHTSLPSQATRNAAGTTLRSSLMGCRLRLVDPNARPLLRGSQPRRMDPLEVCKGRGRNPVRKDGVRDKPVPSACFPLPRERVGLGASKRLKQALFEPVLSAALVSKWYVGQKDYVHSDCFQIFLA